MKANRFWGLPLQTCKGHRLKVKTKQGKIYRGISTIAVRQQWALMYAIENETREYLKESHVQISDIASIEEYCVDYTQRNRGWLWCGGAWDKIEMERQSRR